MTSAPTNKTKVGFGRSILIALGVLIVVPGAAAVLLGVGWLTTAAATVIGALNVSWSQVGIGAATLGVFAVIVGVTHAVRTSRAKLAEYNAAVATLRPSLAATAASASDLA
jgi:hypothetical protein